MKGLLFSGEVISGLIKFAARKCFSDSLDKLSLYNLITPLLVWFSKPSEYSFFLLVTQSLNVKIIFSHFPDPDFHTYLSLNLFLQIYQLIQLGPFHSIFHLVLSTSIPLFIIISPSGVCIMLLMKVISELFVPLSWPWVKTLCEIKLSC